MYIFINNLINNISEKKYAFIGNIANY